MQVHHLNSLLEPAINNMGYEVVRIMTIGVQNPTLQIMIEPKNHSQLSVDDCAKVSKTISALLDEKDPIAGEYTLEVSSPGIDRPLTKPEHFARFVGYEAKIETSEAVDNRKRFKGIIKSLENGNVVAIEMENVIYQIPFDNISKAKLVLNDELWNEYETAQNND